MIENGSLSSFNETKSSDEINFGTKAVKTIVILAALFISLQVISNVIAGLPISWFPGNKDLIYCASGAILFPFIGGKRWPTPCARSTGSRMSRIRTMKRKSAVVKTDGMIERR